MRKVLFTYLFFLSMVVSFTFTAIAQNSTSPTRSLTDQNDKSFSPTIVGGGVLLWDNFLTQSTTGIVSDEWGGLTPGANQTICADDFDVPFGEKWTIDQIAATGFYNPAAEGDAWGVQFYADAGGSPGTILATATVALTPGDPNPAGLLSTPISLTGGTYWISVYGIEDTSTSIDTYRWNWFTSEDPGIGFEPHLTDLAGWFGGLPWFSFTDLGLIPPYNNMMFQLYGTTAIAPSKLLLTEFVVTPTQGEFIEIFNPNASSVDLSNYFLSDVAFPGGPEYYYNVVQGLYGGTFGDFNSKFPDGATIGSGEHQTIALNGDVDFFNTYGVNPNYEIDQAEFQSGTPDGIPDMMETHPGSIYGPDSTHNPGLTNGDEMIMLYYWDGMSDLVGDVDYVLYNSASPTPNDEAIDKTGVTIDGPDADTTGSTYLNDTPMANQLSAPSPGSGFSTQRMDYFEGAQVMFGGNGVTGSDETSEDMNNTWTVDIPTPSAPIPVELTSFTASVTGNTVSLKWSTATELNNSGFDILRQLRDEQWEKIAFITGSGTTTETRNYSFVDDELAVGQYSYRLKQIDFDGTSDFSDIVEVEILAPNVYSLEQNYPNPFNPSTKIIFNLSTDSKVRLTLFDVLGQEVVTLINGKLSAGSHEFDFNAANLNSGVYFYRIDASGIDGKNFSSVKKMILTK